MTTEKTTETEQLVLNIDKVVEFNIFENNELFQELLKLILQTPKFLKKYFAVDLFNYSEELKNLIEAIFRDQVDEVVKYEKYVNLTTITYSVQRVFKRYILKNGL